MAELKKITKLDQKLMETGFIDASIEKDYKKVHTMINSHVKRNGKIISEEMFKKGDEALREWLMLLYKKGASQDKLTSYLRCGLAHLCFDYIESGTNDIKVDDLVSRTLKSLKQRNYHKSFFKVSAVEMKELAARKNAVKKKATVKKVAAKKTSAKKASVKKASSKKTSAKKATVKKAAVKKVSAKKATLKKVAAKKSAVKKTAVKKGSAVRKTVVKKKSEQVKIQIDKNSEKGKTVQRKSSDKQTSKLKSFLNRFFE